MQYIMIFNDDERIANDDEMTLRGITNEVEDLMRSGYFEVESVELISK